MKCLQERGLVLAPSQVVKTTKNPDYEMDILCKKTCIDKINIGSNNNLFDGSHLDIKINFV